MTCCGTSGSTVRQGPVRAAPTLLDGDRQAIDTRALLEGVDVPVTVVWGAADRILPAPDGTGERVEAGHMLHMEAANDVGAVALG